MVNTAVGFIQKSKAESALDALRAMVHTEARVIRGGSQRKVASEVLVPGTWCWARPATRPPADLRLVVQSELQVDEFALTGDSFRVAKGDTGQASPGQPGAEDQSSPPVVL